MRGQNFNAKGNRRIEIKHNLQGLKAKARENLESEKGIKIYAKRCMEPEPVFGNIKQNKHFKGFSLKKLPKINIDFGLVVIAHNFAKWIEKIRLLDFGQNQRKTDCFNAILNRLFSTKKDFWTRRSYLLLMNRMGFKRSIIVEKGLLDTSFL